MCAQFNPFTLFLPGQPTPTGPGKRVKFVKGLIPAHAQKRSVILARGTKYRQREYGSGHVFWCTVSKWCTSSGSICRHSTKSLDTFSDVGEAVGSVRSLFFNLWWNTVVYTGCSPVKHIRLVFIMWWEAVVHTVQLSEACSELAPSVVLRTQNRVITVTARMPRLSLVGRIEKKKNYNKLISFQSFAVVYPYDNIR